MRGNHKHGEAIHGQMTPEYKAWESMKARCYNETSTGYSRYGGRGIMVCSRWLESFSNFLLDLGRRPSRKHSIGRIDNDGNYEPENCEWQTRNEQNRNNGWNKLTIMKAREIRILYRRGYSQADLAQEFDVSQSTISLVILGKTWREEP